MNLFAKYKIVHEKPNSWAVYLKQPGCDQWEPAMMYPIYGAALSPLKETHIWYSEDTAINSMKAFDTRLRTAYMVRMAEKNHIVKEKFYE